MTSIAIEDILFTLQVNDMLRPSSNCSDNDHQEIYEIDLITTQKEKEKENDNDDDNIINRKKKKQCRPVAKMELLTWVPFEITAALLSNGNMNGMGILNVPRNATITATAVAAMPSSPVRTSATFKRIQGTTIPIKDTNTFTTTSSIFSSSLPSHDDDTNPLLQQNQRKRKRSSSSFSSSSSSSP